jgi:hypothetical protein
MMSAVIPFYNNNEEMRHGNKIKIIKCYIHDDDNDDGTQKRMMMMIAVMMMMMYGV